MFLDQIGPNELQQPRANAVTFPSFPEAESVQSGAEQGAALFCSPGSRGARYAPADNNQQKKQKTEVGVFFADINNDTSNFLCMLCTRKGRPHTEEVRVCVCAFMRG